MLRLDSKPASPAEQLATDEVLLDECEAGRGGETLRFWEPQDIFVVVGYANRVAAEVNVAACGRRGVPIHRRCSGGGTVVQLPGGLNYSLFLRITDSGPTRNISAANQFIMAKNRAAIETLFPAAPSGSRPQIAVRGHTDLCLGDLKFAGNSQRRRKHFLLFHGTLLLNCDLALIGELLNMPALQPEYRHGRAHGEFVTNLDRPVNEVKAALARAWDANGESTSLPGAEIQRLAREKYATREWNFKF